MNDFNDINNASDIKTWLITGASSGFGRGLTEKLLARGDRVVATVRNAKALADLEAVHGERLSVALLDLTDVAAVRRVVDDAFALCKRIDVIVSNAAYAVFGAAEEASDEQVAHQIATNLTGSIALIRACLPHLRRQGGGRVLQVSSEGGQITYPAFSLYHATKWGIEGFVETVAKETAPFGIAFTLVEPGPASTSFGQGLVRPAPLAAYAGTPADQVRQAVDTGQFKIIGDPDKMVDAMIAVAGQSEPPLRLTLGSTSYEAIRAALTARRDALDAQREIAFSTDHVLQ
jgi:NAD(P)-dependent dehydrogenase (short-subunit alcohol dehydrogenase family)